MQAFSLGYLANCRYNKAVAEGFSRFFSVRGPILAKPTRKDPGICCSTCMGYNTWYFNTAYLAASKRWLFKAGIRVAWKQARSHSITREEKAHHHLHTYAAKGSTLPLFSSVGYVKSETELRQTQTPSTTDRVQWLMRTSCLPVCRALHTETDFHHPAVRSTLPARALLRGSCALPAPPRALPRRSWHCPPLLTTSEMSEAVARGSLHWPCWEGNGRAPSQHFVLLPVGPTLFPAFSPSTLRCRTGTAAPSCGPCHGDTCGKRPAGGSCCSTRSR